MTGVETPPYQLAVNFPLVDVTDENGPMEWASAPRALLRSVSSESSAALGCKSASSTFNGRSSPVPKPRSVTRAEE